MEQHSVQVIYSLQLAPRRLLPRVHYQSAHSCNVLRLNASSGRKHRGIQINSVIWAIRRRRDATKHDRHVDNFFYLNKMFEAHPPAPPQLSAPIRVAGQFWPQANYVDAWGHSKIWHRCLRIFLRLNRSLVVLIEGNSKSFSWKISDIMVISSANYPHEYYLRISLYFKILVDQCIKFRGFFESISSKSVFNHKMIPNI